MIRLPRDMSHDDVSQWLSNGVYLVRNKPKDGPQQWVPCRWVGMDGGRVVSSELGGERRRFATAHTSCAAVWPELGCFNSGRGYAVHMSRIVERQYRRTYHQRAIEVTVPWAYRVGLSLGMEAAVLSHWSVVYDLPWLGTWPESFDEGLAMLERGCPTVAINRRLIVAGNRNTDKRLYYLDGTLVANSHGGRLIPMCRDHELAALNRMLGGRFDVL